MMEKFLQECKKVIVVDHCVLKPFKDYILVWREGVGLGWKWGIHVLKLTLNKEHI